MPRTPKLAANAAQLPVATTVAERLHLLMKRRKVRNADLAAAVGVVATTVSKWRNGSQPLAGDRLGEAARFLGVTREWLRGEAEPTAAAQPRGDAEEAAFEAGVSYAIGAIAQTIADLGRGARHARLRPAAFAEAPDAETARRAARKE